jgi:hypothetical protein
LEFVEKIRARVGLAGNEAEGPAARRLSAAILEKVQAAVAARDRVDRRTFRNGRGNSISRDGAAYPSSSKPLTGSSPCNSERLRSAEPREIAARPNETADARGVPHDPEDRSVPPYCWWHHAQRSGIAGSWITAQPEPTIQCWRSRSVLLDLHICSSARSRKQNGPIFAVKVTSGRSCSTCPTTRRRSVTALPIRPRGRRLNGCERPSTEPRPGHSSRGDFVRDEREPCQSMNEENGTNEGKRTERISRAASRPRGQGSRSCGLGRST